MTGTAVVPALALDIAFNERMQREEVPMKFALLSLIVTCALSAVATAQVIVTPGHTGSGYGVTITNSTVSGGNGEISDWGQGDAYVNLQDDFEGEVDGFEDGDIMDVGDDVDAEIEASGGEIDINGTNTTIEVTNPEGSTHNVIVNLPGGGSVTVKPGNTVEVSS